MLGSLRGPTLARHAAHVEMSHYYGAMDIARVMGEKMGGKGDVAILNAPPGIVIRDQRTKGFVDGMSGNSQVVGGIPQEVLKVKLVDHPEKGLTGLEPVQLIDRVLVGPCEHSEVLGQALRQALESAGVADAGNKIIHTGIPLRAKQR